MASFICWRTDKLGSLLRSHSHLEVPHRVPQVQFPKKVTVLQYLVVPREHGLMRHGGHYGSSRVSCEWGRFFFFFLVNKQKHEER